MDFKCFTNDKKENVSKFQNGKNGGMTYNHIWLSKGINEGTGVR